MRRNVPLSVVCVVMTRANNEMPNCVGKVPLRRVQKCRPSADHGSSAQASFRECRKAVCKMCVCGLSTGSVPDSSVCARQSIPTQSIPSSEGICPENRLIPTPNLLTLPPPSCPSSVGKCPPRDYDLVAPLRISELAYRRWHGSRQLIKEKSTTLRFLSALKVIGGIVPHRLFDDRESAWTRASWQRSPSISGRHGLMQSTPYQRLPISHGSPKPQRS